MRKMSQSDVPPRLGRLADSGGPRSIDLALLQAVLQGDGEKAREAISHGADVNFCDPQSGAALLHLAAGRSARFALKALIASPDLDYLVKDKQDRLPSAVAWEFGQNPVIGTFLMKKEIQHAHARGIAYVSLLTEETTRDTEGA